MHPAPVVNDLVKRPASAGEHNHRAKIRQADVPTIRARHERGAELKALADDYGVSISAIHQCVTRKTWRHVP